ncbi:putative GTP-binding protein SAR1A [Blattamonas nauphoetae]|uniref:GTP-binding protein SAR1A n=1 Tax=Blattamonas nauphoetae TaxID=2049346 RepID=A0ABQ9Y9M1_9EUKA|nr:putative GTP-binding protein SAR1A [Blattamonas nauphoetae]
MTQPIQPQFTLIKLKRAYLENDSITITHILKLFQDYSVTFTDLLFLSSILLFGKRRSLSSFSLSDFFEGTIPLTEHWRFRTGLALQHLQLSNEISFHADFYDLFQKYMNDTGINKWLVGKHLNSLLSLSPFHDSSNISDVIDSLILETLPKATDTSRAISVISSASLTMNLNLFEENSRGTILAFDSAVHTIRLLFTLWEHSPLSSIPYSALNRLIQPHQTSSSSIFSSAALPVSTCYPLVLRNTTPPSSLFLLETDPETGRLQSSLVEDFLEMNGWVKEQEFHDYFRGIRSETADFLGETRMVRDDPDEQDDELQQTPELLVEFYRQWLQTDPLADEAILTLHEFWHNNFGGACVQDLLVTLVNRIDASVSFVMRTHTSFSPWIVLAEVLLQLLNIANPAVNEPSGLHTDFSITHAKQTEMHNLVFSQLNYWKTRWLDVDITETATFEEWSNILDVNKGRIDLWNLIGVGAVEAAAGILADLKKVQLEYGADPTQMPIEDTFTVENLTITAYDMGGHPSVRHLWKEYLTTANAIVYIVDAHDHDRLEESRVALEAILNDQRMEKVPICILGNKIDLPYAANESDLKRALGVELLCTGKSNFDTKGRRPLEVFMCSITQKQGYGTGIKWLSNFF